MTRSARQFGARSQYVHMKNWLTASDITRACFLDVSKNNRIHNVLNPTATLCKF